MRRENKTHFRATRSCHHLNRDETVDTQKKYEPQLKRMGKRKNRNPRAELVFTKPSSFQFLFYPEQ